MKGFRVWGCREWALKPKQQQRKLEPRTDVGRFFGYTVGGKAYRMLEDGSNKVFERRDVLMEETSSKFIKKTFVPGPASTPFLTGQTDGDKEDGAMDMLDADVELNSETPQDQSHRSCGAVGFSTSTGYGPSCRWWSSSLLSYGL